MTPINHDGLFIHARLARAAYDANAPLPEGWQPDPLLAALVPTSALAHEASADGSVVTRPATGMQLRAFINAETGERALAFAGTDGVQDWVHNLELGAGQYADSAALVARYVTEALADAPEATLRFLGHSLGGAHAQYAAHDALLAHPDAARRLDLRTFNALGALDGLADRSGVDGNGLYAEPLATLSAAHYVSEGDFVPRLGGGHVGGAVYLFPKVTGQVGQPFGLIGGHGIETFLRYEALGHDASVLVTDRPHQYLEIDALRTVAGDIALAGNALAGDGNEVGQVEAYARLATMAGAVLALAQPGLKRLSASGSILPEAELNRLLGALDEGIANDLATLGAQAGPIGLLGEGLTLLRALGSEDGIARLASNALINLGVNLSFLGLAVTMVEEVLDVAGIDGAFNAALLPHHLVGPIGDRVAERDPLLERLTSLGGNVSSLLRSVLGHAPDDAPSFPDDAILVTGGESTEVTLVMAKPAGPDGRLLLLRAEGAPSVLLGGDVVSGTGTAHGNGEREFLVRVPPGAREATLTLATQPVDGGAAEQFVLTIADQPLVEVRSKDEGLPLDTVVVIIEPASAAPARSLVQGTAYDDLLYGPRHPNGDPSEPIVGSDGHDELRGLEGDDDLFGRGGSDFLDGGAGRDFLFGEDGNDVLVGADDDLLSGGAGDDRLEGGHTLAGNAGDDLLLGTADSVLLVGGAGNDTVHGGPGRELLFGDSWIAPAGRNTAVAFTSNATSDGRSATLDGFYFDEFAHGGNDALFGGAGNDVLLGGAGDDRLFGGSGHDELEGQDGNDRLFGGVGDDFLHGDRLRSTRYVGSDFLKGGAGDDVLLGGAEVDVIYGDDDNDLLFGDHSYLVPDSGTGDHLYGGAGDDRIEAGPGSDIVYGGAGRDRVIGDHPQSGGAFQGSDHIDGGEGDDILYGVGYGDVIHGGLGDDVLVGEAGDGQHVLKIGNLGQGAIVLPEALHGPDILFGGPGHDLLLGEGGDDALYGGTGDDRLLGGRGDDELRGDDGDDTLTGGDGDDRLDGGAGDDYLDLGHGSDRVLFRVGDGHDRIAATDRFGDYDILKLTGVAKPQDVFVEQQGLDTVWRFRAADGTLLSDTSLTFENGANIFELVSFDSRFFLFGNQAPLAGVAWRVTPDTAPTVDLSATPALAELAPNGEGTTLRLRTGRGDDRLELPALGQFELMDAGGRNTVVLPEGASLAARTVFGNGREHYRFDSDAGPLSLERTPAFDGAGGTLELRSADGLRIDPSSVSEFAPLLVGSAPTFAVLAGDSAEFSLLERLLDHDAPNGRVSGTTHALTLSLPDGGALPNGYRFDPDSGTLSVSLDAAPAGTAVRAVPLQLSVTDPHGLSLAVPITVREVPRAPVAAADPAHQLPLARRDGTVLVAPGDIDGDGDADVLQGDRRGLAKLHFQAPGDGADTFAVATPAPFKGLGVQDSLTARPADFDGDSIHDLVVSAGDQWHIVAGGPSLASFDFGTLGAEALLERFTQPGTRSPGDLTGDGIDDLVLRHWLFPGELFPAEAPSGTQRVRTLDPLSNTTGAIRLTDFLARAGAVGDFDGDSVDDFAVPGGLLFGTGQGLPLTADASWLDGVRGLALPDIRHGPSGVGDLNGDGRPDLAAYRYRPEGSDILIAFGGPRDAAPATTALALTDLPLDGEAILAMGETFTALGDVNGDGLDDLGIGSETYSLGASRGFAAVLFGDASLAGKALNTASLGGGAGVLLPTEVDSGYSVPVPVLPAPDVDGDGVRELLVSQGSMGGPSDLWRLRDAPSEGDGGSVAAPERLAIRGSAGDDRWLGPELPAVRFDSAGNDFGSYGGRDDLVVDLRGDDRHQTGAGNDRIRDLLGDDVHVPGRGDDVVVDGAGNDRYLLGAGSGQDRILDAGGDDVLVLDRPILPGELRFERAGDDLLLKLTGGDEVQVQGWFAAPTRQIERFEIEDLAFLDHDDVPALLVEAGSDATPDPWPHWQPLLG